MSGTEASGAGRRLTIEEEQRAAQMYADGLSTRAVADALRISPSTASRLKQRLAERAGAPPEALRDEDTDADVMLLTDDAVHSGHDAVLEELRRQREDLAAEVVKHQDRAQASRTAVTQLEYERREALAAGRDAQQFRARLNSARDDASDWEAAAEIASGRLAEMDRQIDVVADRQNLAELRAELAGAIAARDALYAVAGARQRAAVLAVRDAAAEFTATYAEDQAASQRVEELAAAVAAQAVQLGQPGPDLPASVSTAIYPPWDAVAPEPVALGRAISEARIGNSAAVAVRLAEAFGWLPADPAELAAERARMAAKMAGQQQPQGSAPEEYPAHWPSSGVGVDASGNVLGAINPNLHRPLPVTAPAPQSQRGWLGGQPWPQ